ncbi:hypothetical protein J3R73_004970 [Labrys monachus]|uniref:Cyclic nucleotide-binding domain-containing protein n=1 Tax=Labrys monachus TaxID=217067 RepID=A0ABU0FM55_9HYPH|nr:hypothetical protein [Labrys monachus]
MPTNVKAGDLFGDRGLAGGFEESRAIIVEASLNGCGFGF